MQGIHHIALRVKDCLVSKRFYEEACGVGEIRRSETDGDVTAVWLRAGPTVLMLERTLRGAGASEGSGHVLVFAISDLAAAERSLAALGASVTDRTPSTVYFQDPDGHRLGLSVYRFDDKAS